MSKENSETDYKRLLESLNLLDQASSMASLNRRDHVNLQIAATELRNYFQSKLPAKEPPASEDTATRVPQTPPGDPPRR